MRELFIIYGFLLCCFHGFSQDAYQIGILPNININKKISKDWKVNFRTESRQRFSFGVFGKGANTEYKYILTDFSATLSKKTGLNNSLATGYLMRFRDGQTVYRFTQQYTIAKKYRAIRIAQRFRSDQTFQDTQAPVLRFRYRITPEIPLAGLSVDPKELYLKINNEYVNAFQSNTYDLEIRLVPVLGYEFSDYNKVEFGLDYRIGSFINNTTKHSFWFTANWYVSI